MCVAFFFSLSSLSRRVSPLQFPSVPQPRSHHQSPSRDSQLPLRRHGLLVQGQLSFPFYTPFVHSRASSDFFALVSKEECLGIAAKCLGATSGGTIAAFPLLLMGERKVNEMREVSIVQRSVPIDASFSFFLSSSSSKFSLSPHPFFSFIRLPSTLFGFEAKLYGQSFHVCPLPLASFSSIRRVVAQPFFPFLPRFRFVWSQPQSDEIKHTHAFFRTLAGWIAEGKIRVLPSQMANKQGINGLVDALEEIKVSPSFVFFKLRK